MSQTLLGQINRYRVVIACLMLAAVIVFVFSDVRYFDFIDYDDELYVTGNIYVQNGLTGENIRWTFAGDTKDSANWHPLTWISLMLDYELFRLNPGGYHWTNLLFHIANTLLLFLVLKILTGQFWRSIVVAALFAFHPLHVETVAWISQRKDLLCTFFGLLAVVAYIRYVRKPSFWIYGLLIGAFAMSLMSKPMLVTLPFLLLLIDYWPLQRFQNGRYFLLIREKIPLFLMASASSLVAFWAQKSGGAVLTLEVLPFSLRFFNALFAYAQYIQKTLWPFDLAVLYPHPGLLPFLQILVSALLLLSISILVMIFVKTKPYLFVGWFWFIGTLIPVIGLVQVGVQSMADRYTYLPITGLFIMMVWGIYDLLNKITVGKITSVALTIFALSVLAISTHNQLRHWENGIALFQHTLKVTKQNVLAHNNLGVALLKESRYDEAIVQFQEALKIHPRYARAHFNLGVTFGRQKKYAEAEYHYNEALKIKPDYVDARYNLGTALAGQGRYSDAIKEYRAALRIEPNHFAARHNLEKTLPLTAEK